jgi:hypothetical protein
VRLGCRGAGRRPSRTEQQYRAAANLSIREGAQHLGRVVPRMRLVDLGVQVAGSHETDERCEIVGLIIAATGASTGGSFNPARAFGPAVHSGVMDDLWCYLTAPVVAALLATTVRSMSHRAPVLTCQLCGDLGPPA